jgi:predicted phage tail protein
MAAHYQQQKRSRHMADVKLVEVKLYGELRKKFGHLHRFDIRSPAEAVRALVANFPSFEAHMSSAHERGIGYKVFVADEALSHAEDILNPTGGATIKISPRLLGAKDAAVTQILIGVALVAIGVSMGNPYVLSAMSWGDLAYSGMAGTIGFALMLGGVAQLLAPSPQGIDMKEAPGNSPSYLFNGPVNTAAQGHPVPIGYGRMIVGSAVISAGVIAEDIPV